MEERIPMNTKSLQKHFKSEYESFFAKNDLVVSANHCFAWNTGGFRDNKDKIHIKQKVPTKTFCGVNIINERKIKFDKIICFDIIKREFSAQEFSETIKPEQENAIEKLLLDFLDQYGFNKGLLINFLSENPRGHGLGFSGTCGALIANGIYIILKKIDNNILKEYNEFAKSKEFEEIFSLGLDIERIFKYGNSIGNNCYSAMMNTKLPIITFSEDFINKQKGAVLKTYKYKIKDFFGIHNKIDEINLDYGIIFSGINSKIESIQHVSYDTKKDIETFQNDILGLLHKKGIKDTKKFPFKNIFSSGFNQTFKDMGLIHNFKTLYALQQIIEKGFDEYVIYNFIQILKENNYMSIMFEGERKITNLFKFYFDFFKKSEIEDCAIFPINILKTGGSFVFVCRYNKSRETIINVLQKMKELGYQDTTLEYASWIDGMSDDGIKIEQWINDGIFSQYIQKDQVYYKDNQGKSYVGNYNEILASQKTGLLLDMIHNKMYLNGKKLTSADLCSQTTTIDILYKLMENISADIANKEFEISSYSKNKNEMLGKIVLPLISLIEKETGEVFPIICKGSIYDFYMKLNPSVIKIAIIKKI